MILSREETYETDLIEQRTYIAKQARKEGVDEGMEKGKAEGKIEGKAEAIESALQIRFPDGFADRFQPWRAQLYEKPLPVLDSLFPLSVTCSSLSEFTQKL